MKKIKITLMTLAVLISVGGAIASKPHNFGILYYWTGSTYMPAGTLGVNYVCESSPSVCTYTFNNGVYTPYNTMATYFRIGAADPDTKPVTKEKK